MNRLLEESEDSVAALLTDSPILPSPTGLYSVATPMQPTFDTINTTGALCTYIALNTITSGTSTKPVTAETTA
jgi:hypothetical protein